MRNSLSNAFGLGLVAGIIGFAVYFFAFGQTFEGHVISLDLESPGPSPKETLLLISLLLIFSCPGGMAVIAKSD